MYTFLLVILILVSLAVMVAVLLQAGKGGGLAASFGGATTAADSLIGSRQAGNLLTKVSWYGGGLFLLIAFVLGLMSKSARVPRSVLDQPFSSAPATAPKAGAAAVPVTPPPAATTPPTTPPPKQ
ncbi:MAG: preprotein translocase subunit SecG [Gemmatimonadaceae bacterium]|nr:preprotein translocase subunit SecG [Gemmatimonadaceae bacterium]